MKGLTLIQELRARLPAAPAFAGLGPGWWVPSPVLAAGIGIAAGVAVPLSADPGRVAVTVDTLPLPRGESDAR